MIARDNLNKNFLFSAMAGLIVASLLFMPVATDNLWWREVFNSGHTPLFLFVSFVLYFRLYATLGCSKSAIIYFVVLVTGLILGIAIEMLQWLLQREASVDDLYRDFFGIISGLALVSFTRHKLLRYKILMSLFSLGFLLLGTSALFQTSWHYIQRNMAFPLITKFDEKWSSKFVRFDNAELLGLSVSASDDNAEKLYRVRFDSGKYPGISIVEPEQNWWGYSKLRFKVFSDNKANIELVLRVHDKSHNQNYNDRFNQQYLIRPGLNEIVVNLSQVRESPVDRDLDLANIAGVMLFLINTETSLFLEVSNIYLEL